MEQVGIKAREANSQDMSNNLELMLRKAGRDLADWQVCRFWKVPEAFTQTPCDFFGYTRVGRAIMIEAKQVHRSSLPIGKSPGLAPHQWNALREAFDAGCLALLCWTYGDLCATLDVPLIVSASQGRKSIPWKAIPKHYIHSMDGWNAHIRLLRPWLAHNESKESP